MADTLKTDYKDDVLDTSVNERRKYQMIQNEDGTVSFVDVTEYLQVGDSFGAKDINALNNKLSTVSTGANKITITRKTGTFTATGTHMIDLGGKKNIFGLSAFILSGAIPIPCAIQGQRHLRFNMQPVTTVESEVSYEYFEYSIT